MKNQEKKQRRRIKKMNPVYKTIESNIASLIFENFERIEFMSHTPSRENELMIQILKEQNEDLIKILKFHKKADE